MVLRWLSVFQPRSRQVVPRLFITAGICLVFIAIFTMEQDGHHKAEQRVKVSVKNKHLDPAEKNIVQDTRDEELLENELKVTKENKLKDAKIVDLKYKWDQSNQEQSDALKAEQILIEGLIPSKVHYIWCGKDLFEYREYLSVLSVLRTINPDQIVIHYEYLPSIDRRHYHQWLDFLKHDYSYLIMEKMNDNQMKFCEGDRETQIALILKLLNNQGGMYISHKIWMLGLPPVRRKADFVMALHQESVDGYILMRKGVLSVPEMTYKQILSNSSLKAQTSQCAPVHHVYRGHNHDGCLLVSGEKFDRFYPMDIWELDDEFGRLSRRIFYGTEEIRRPKPTFDELVPNIGHMVWIGGGEMDFLFYLSLLSMLYVAKVDVVYIHGDKPPTGHHWALIEGNSRIRDRVKLITFIPPDHIYQGVIEPWYRVIMSDITRVDLMIKYGGLYADTDAIWVKGLTYEDRGYDAVASFDWIDWSVPYPDSVNFGLTYGKRNAPFWQLFKDSMRTLHNDVDGFTGVMNPYKILERYPHLLRIDRHLQVICFESRCHPIWIKDYHNISRDHITDNSLVNWRQDTNALHWTHPNPFEFKDEATLRNSSGLFADVGRFVLEQAGLW